MWGSVLEGRSIYLVPNSDTPVNSLAETYTGRVGPKGQVTLPKPLREKYHLKEGENILIVPEEEEEGIMLKHDASRTLRGRLKGKLDSAGIEKDIRELRRQWRLQLILEQRIKSTDLVVKRGDTVGLIKYFEDAPLPAADSVFKSAEEGKTHLIVPSIVIGEFFYLALKGRLKTEDPLATITELVSDIESSQFLVRVGMEISDRKVFLELKVHELHDRMICALAIRRSAESIVTNDLEIQAEKRIATTR